MSKQSTMIRTRQAKWWQDFSSGRREHLPLSTDLRLNQPRYATLPNIMKAKSKPIKKFTLQDLNVEIKSDLEVVEVTEPPKRRSGLILSSVDELIDKLKNEAHVI